MRDHPIPTVTEPLQYRAIGIVRGVYRPNDSEKFTQGSLSDANGVEIEAVVLGRVLPLMKRHVSLECSHLWVVYPRSRESDHLHLQIAGIWEPSTLGGGQTTEISDDSCNDSTDQSIDQLPEGDDYFSIRGDLIYTKPEEEEIVIRVRQQKRNDSKRAAPFKLKLTGRIPLENLRCFVSLDVRRQGQKLYVEEHKVIAKMSTRAGKKSSTGRGSRQKFDRTNKF